jgi:hypothetical protein
MHPSPSTETVRPVEPRVRVAMDVLPDVAYEKGQSIAIGLTDFNSCQTMQTSCARADREEGSPHTAPGGQGVVSSFDPALIEAETTGLKRLAQNVTLVLAGLGASDGLATRLGVRRLDGDLVVGGRRGRARRGRLPSGRPCWSVRSSRRGRRRARAFCSARSGKPPAASSNISRTRLPAAVSFASPAGIEM